MLLSSIGDGNGDGDGDDSGLCVVELSLGYRSYGRPMVVLNSWWLTSIFSDRVYLQQHHR